MKAVILIGVALMPISCIPLFFFKDPLAARQRSHSSSNEAADNSATREEGSSTAQVPTAVPPSSTVAPRPRRCGCLGPRHVPVILALSDFITMVGAGMTVKFFNLFFIQDEHFSPTAICWLQTSYPLVIAVFTKFTERLAKPIGRAQASLLFFSCNVLCLFLLSGVQYLPLLLVVFLVRGGFANSTYPIDRSILMDYTPSSRRGLWNAVESFTSMTWSGSAFLGGMLSDFHDYRFTFLITALVYALGCLVYSPLLVLVPRNEEAVREVSLTAAATTEASPAS